MSRASLQSSSRTPSFSRSCSDSSVDTTGKFRLRMYPSFAKVAGSRTIRVSTMGVCLAAAMGVSNLAKARVDNSPSVSALMLAAKPIVCVQFLIWLGNCIVSDGPTILTIPESSTGLPPNFSVPGLNRTPSGNISIRLRLSMRTLPSPFRITSYPTSSALADSTCRISMSILPSGVFLRRK